MIIVLVNERRNQKKAQKRTKKTCKKGKPPTHPAPRVETGQVLQAEDSSPMTEVPGAPREGSSDGGDAGNTVKNYVVAILALSM